MEIDSAWAEVDFADILGVCPDAARPEITGASRDLAREVHPHASSDHADEDRFRAVSTADAVLRNVRSTAACDRLHRRAISGRTRPRPSGGDAIQVDQIDGAGTGAAPVGRRRSAFDERFANGAGTGAAPVGRRRSAFDERFATSFRSRSSARRPRQHPLRANLPEAGR